MKKITLALGLFGVLTFAEPLSLHEADKIGEETIQNFKQIFKAEIKSYKYDTLLMTKVCIEKTDLLLTNFNQSLQGGIKLKRITQKERNPKNKPETQEELKILQAFELLAQAGTFMPKNVIQMTQEDNYKYFAPIMLDEKTCVACHGSKERVSPEIANLLQKNYPNDKAINYQRGDFRGAIVVTIPSQSF
jgi:hypothetical protein